MEGRNFSHYQVLERLGGGGMGVVYRAVDTRLDRHVALKFLPHELTRDDEARARFMQEAKAASAFDHPNICTVYEIDSTPEGQMFLAMALYDGATLKKRIDEGPLPIEEALDITVQVATGLAKAHDEGIVHRDIKPANLMLTRDGFVKIVDFGVAKLLGVTGPTQVGSTVGTVSYMSPEQVAGDDADQQSDVWSLGVVLYEMLTGELPFRGESQWVVMNAIGTREPEAPSSLRAEVPPHVDRVVMRALQKSKEARHQDIGELHAEATASLAKVTGAPGAQGRAEPAHATGRPVGSRGRIAAFVAGALVLLGGVGWGIDRSRDRNWARGEAVLEIGRLADAGDYGAALDVSERAMSILPDDPTLLGLVEQVSGLPTIQTEPPGATVYVREYDDIGGESTLLGSTPLAGVRVPLGPKRWRLELDGHAPVDWVGGAGAVIDVVLPRAESVPEGMILVPETSSGSTIAGMLVTGIGALRDMPLADFYIDRFEVTNEAYVEFVQAGGYERPELWTHEFIDEGRRLTWSEAMERFEDATGRPGPATWELGRPKSGEESLPVSGVSWYEAAAYAEFRGLDLPTLRHWIRAASTNLGGSIVPLSNFGGEGPAQAGTYQGMSLVGAYDMAGNVREWLWNASGTDRHAAGGAWSDPTYFFSGPNVQSPFNRLPTNGFRLAKYTAEGVLDGEAGAEMPLLVRDYDREEPVSDEVFDIFRAQYAYDPRPLEAEVEEVLENEHGRVERISFSGPDTERMHAYLYLPPEAGGGLQTVVYFPGSGALRLSPDPDPRVELESNEFVASGRAFLRPIYRYTYSRGEADRPVGMNTTWPRPTREYADLVRGWVTEVRRSIDLIESRPELDSERIAYVGFSWGGRLAAIVPAVEPRVKVNIAWLGGLASGEALPEADQINFVTRITVPTLMLNGLHDPLEPMESSQLPMYRLLGTPVGDKHHVWYQDWGHGLPLNERIRESLDFLDRYFGPAN